MVEGESHNDTKPSSQRKTNWICLFLFLSCRFVSLFWGKNIAMCSQNQDEFTQEIQKHVWNAQHTNETNPNERSHANALVAFPTANHTCICVLPVFSIEGFSVVDGSMAHSQKVASLSHDIALLIFHFCHIHKAKRSRANALVASPTASRTCEEPCLMATVAVCCCLAVV